MMSTGAYERRGETGMRKMLRSLAQMVASGANCFPTRGPAVAAMLMAGILASPARAQSDWPTGPITIVVPYAAGGNTDIMARLLADSLGKSLKQAVSVDNKGGAGGAIGADFVARSAKDGYTLLFGTTAQVSVVPYVQHVHYDAKTAFAPVSIYGTNPNILAINAALPVKNVAELIAYAKAHPNEVNYGSGGIGSIAHLASALFAKQAGIELQHVPYKGGSQTITELLAGHIQMYLGNTSEILPMATAAELRLLAVSSAQRLPDVPDLPTIGETLPGYVVDAWNGLLAPAGVPQAALTRLEAETIKAAHDPDVVGKLRKLGIVAAGSTSANFRSTIVGEDALYRGIVESAGIVAAP